MQITATTSNADRGSILCDMLGRLRDETYAKVRQLRQDQREEGPSPGDEADAARLSAETETRANLIERAEERLRLIDEALARVGARTYGTCAECGDEITIERLRILPFAALCVDCQSGRGDAGRWGRHAAAESSGVQWAPAADAEREDVERLRPSEDASIAVSDLDVESRESEAPKRRRGRPRKVGAKNGR